MMFHYHNICLYAPKYCMKTFQMIWTVSNESKKAAHRVQFKVLRDEKQTCSYDSLTSKPKKDHGPDMTLFETKWQIQCLHLPGLKFLNVGLPVYVSDIAYLQEIVRYHELIVTILLIASLFVGISRVIRMNKVFVYEYPTYRLSAESMGCSHRRLMCISSRSPSCCLSLMLLQVITLWRRGGGGGGACMRLEISGCGIDQSQNALWFHFAVYVAEGTMEREKSRTTHKIFWLLVCLNMKTLLSTSHRFTFTPYLDLTAVFIWMNAGVSRKIGSKSYIYTGTVGTMAYLSPEIMRDGKLSEKADIYAFSMISRWHIWSNVNSI